MKNPILVDCDGVISNMTRSVLALAHGRGIALDKTEDDVNTWDYQTCLGWIDVDRWVDEAVRQREFTYRMYPYPGAFMALRRLEAAIGKENVLICTAPWSGEWAAQRYAWLAEFAGVDASRVIMCKQKHRIPGFLIDDAPKNLGGRPFHDAFLVARAYNVGAPFTRGTLAEAVDLIQPRSEL